METVFGSQASLVASHAVRVGMGLAATLLMVRGLDREGLGAFVMVSTAAVMAAQVVDAGMSSALTSEMARGDGASALFRRIRSWRRLLAAGLAPAIVVWLATRDTDVGITGLVAITAVTVSLPTRTWNSAFAAARMYRYPALFGVLAQGVFLLGIGLGVSLGKPLIGCLLALAAREVMVGALPLLRGRRRWTFDASADRPAADAPRGLIALALATAASAALFPVDVFVLEAARDAGTVGDYGIATRVVLPVMAAVPLLCAPLLPAFAEDAARHGAPRPEVVIWGAATALGAALPVSLALLLSGEIVQALAGEPRPVAAASLAALAPLPAVIVFGSVGSLALIAARRYVAWCAVAATALTVNVALDLAWVHDLGAAGVGRATLIAEMVAAAGAIGFLARRGTAALIVAAAYDLALSLAPTAVAVAVWWATEPETVAGRLLAAATLSSAAALTFWLSPLARRIRARLAPEATP